jgi:hypothetical protein
MSHSEIVCVNHERFAEDQQQQQQQYNSRKTRKTFGLPEQQVM